MATLTESLSLDERTKVPARRVRAWVHELLDATGVSDRMLAQGINMAEAQFNRLASGQSGGVKATTLLPLRRVARLVEAGRQTLTSDGLKRWLAEPNPYLDDVPPVLCLRSDKELEKVLALLASIRYGFPA